MIIPFKTREDVFRFDLQGLQLATLRNVLTGKHALVGICVV